MFLGRTWIISIINKIKKSRNSVKIEKNKQINQTSKWLDRPTDMKIASYKDLAKLNKMKHLQSLCIITS